ncbi:MAG: alpha/beta fold hydrolase [Egibacteraceae bacterium]
MAGQGEDLVLAHGGSGRRQTFGPLREHLRGWRSWALDLRGHGESTHAPGAYQLEQVADDVAAFIDQRLEGPAAVYGHSFAGHVGCVLAARHPRLVRALVIGDAPVDPHRLHAHISSQRPMTFRWQQLAASGMGSQAIARELEVLPIRSGQAELVAAREVFGSGHPWFAQMGAALATHDPDFLAAVIDRFWDTHRALDPAHLLPRLACPVLVLQADAAAGGLFTDADVELLRRFVAVPVEVIWLSGVGHGLQLQAPEVIASALDVTLRALLSRTANDIPR